MATVLYFQSGVAESNTSKLEGFYRYAKTARWRVQVVPYAEAVANREWLDPDAEPNLKVLLSFWKPDGAVVDAGSSPGLLRASAFAGTPVVFLDKSVTAGETCVTGDSRAIAAIAARELLEGDAASFAYVPFPAPVSWSRERGEAFAEMVRLNGREYQVCSMENVSSGYNSYSSCLCAWLEALPKPLGVFAANDHVASITLGCAARAGIKVPDDMTLIGVDNDLTICEHTSPSLSSIVPDFGRAGYLAGELLQAKMAHRRRKVAGITFGALGVRRRESTFAYSRPVDDRIRAAMAFIHGHACDKITSRDVIQKMRCSRRLAEVRFREALGHSILDEIQAVRLDHAKSLLVNTHETVAAIAARCGYATSEPLRRLFLAAEGMAPLRWRNKAAQM